MAPQGAEQKPHKSYGLWLKCPKCPPEHYFGMLKIPSIKAKPCPNCGTRLVPSRSK